MNNNISTVAVIVVLVGTVLVIVSFGFYAIIGFWDWLYHDPFNWINIPTNEERVSDDVRLCREKGGVAILSGWTGGLKECQIPNL